MSTPNNGGAAAGGGVLAGALRVTCTDSPASGGVTTAIQAAVRELPAGTYWIVTDEARAAVAELIAADKEYDEARDGYDPRTATPEQIERLARAELRRRRALSNIEGGQ